MKMINSSKEILERIEIAFWTVSIRIMGNRKLVRALFASVCILVFFLLVGAIVQSKASSFDKGTGSTEDSVNGVLSVQPDGAPTVIPGQSNLLVILVDDLSSKQPSLIGLWLAGRISSAPQIIFLPIFPSLSNMESENIASSFKIDSDGTLEGNFFKALQVEEIWWDHYLVADKNSLVDLIALMNGISWSGKEYTGPEMVALMPGVLDQPRLALEMQAQIFGEFCRKLPDWAINADPGIIEGLYKSRFRSDMQLGLIQAARLGISGPERIPVCEFPTLTGVSQNWSLD